MSEMPEPEQIKLENFCEGAAVVAFDDLDRVQRLNVIGWLQPEIGPDNRLRVTDGAPTLLWDKWVEILRWAERRTQETS